MHSAPKSFCYAMTSCTSHAYPGFPFFATVSKNCAHTVFFSVFIGRERSPLRKQLATDLELELNVSHCLCLRCGSALGYSVYPQSSAEHLTACVLLPLSSPTISRRKIKASGDEKTKQKVNKRQVFWRTIWSSWRCRFEHGQFPGRRSGNLQMCHCWESLALSLLEEPRRPSRAPCDQMSAIVFPRDLSRPTSALLDSSGS